MGLFKKLFGKSKQEIEIAIDKSKVPVYPMLKAGNWQAINQVEAIPFVKDKEHLELAVIFAQDAGTRFEYITPSDLQHPEIKANYENWQQHIDAYPYEFEVSERLDNRVIFASGEDHSSEKILSPAFLHHACEVLHTDRLIISAPRRRCLMITSYHENFPMLENFFHLHFIAFREEEYGNEPITEMIFTANNKNVEYAVPLGFRINLYEKDGHRKLVYATMDELFDENGQINFQKIIERNKIPVLFKR